MFKKWSKWEDISVRTSLGGGHFLLQMKTRVSDNKKIFKNRRIDSTFLFHTEQGITNKIIN